SGLRRLGPASRYPDFLYANARGTYWSLGPVPTSPNGRNIALIDLGQDAAGHEAPQIFLLDVRSGRRTQVTRQSQVATGDASHPNRAVEYVNFIDKRTLSFYGGTNSQGTAEGTAEAYRVKTDSNGVPEEIPAVTLASGARVVAQFGVTGRHP